MSDVYKQIEKAFYSVLPLVSNMVYLETMANRQVEDGCAGVNYLFHNKMLAKPQDYINAPNIDTVYSTGYLDLSEGDIVIHKPASKRFFNILFLDAYGCYIDLIGAGGKGGTEEQDYILTMDCSAVYDKNYTKIVSPTQIVSALARIIVFEESDAEYDYIHNLQKGITITYVDGNPARNVWKYRCENHPAAGFSSPSDYLLSLKTEELFQIYNRYAAGNPPPHNVSEYIKRAEPYGIGAGRVFSYSIFSEEDAAAVKSLTEDLKRFIRDKMPTLNQRNGWHFTDRKVSQPDTDYRIRAWITFFGPGTNPVQISEYLSTYTDCDGKQLHGENKYRIHFEKPPAVKKYGFWSLTPYTFPKMQLNRNELEKYCINDRSDFRCNDDGSIDIYISSTKPAEDKIANWLPVEKGNFQLCLRVYFSAEDVFLGTWQPPSIKRME